MRFADYLQNIGRAIAYHPKLKKLLGSCTATIFFEQIFYWSDKGSMQDGWIYKTSEHIEEETGLTYKEQRTARKHLVHLGVLQEKYERLKHRMLFRVNIEALNSLYAQAYTENSPNDQRATGHLTNGQFGNVPTGSSFKEQETTPEITAKTTVNIYGSSTKKQLQEERFLKFWEAYPKKLNKGAARKAFYKINPDDDMLETFLTAIKKQSMLPDWMKDKGQFIPYPASWLNGERWEDDAEVRDLRMERIKSFRSFEVNE